MRLYGHSLPLQFSVDVVPCRLSEEGAGEMSENLAKVRYIYLHTTLAQRMVQTFRDRLAEVIDQAQHFAALGPVGGAGQSNDVAAAFREGLDATERDSEH